MLSVYRLATRHHQQYENSDGCTKLIYALFISLATTECM